MKYRLIGFFIWWSISIGCVISSIILLFHILYYGKAIVIEPNIIILDIEIIWTILGALFLLLELKTLLTIYHNK